MTLSGEEVIKEVLKSINYSCDDDSSESYGDYQMSEILQKALSLKNKQFREAVEELKDFFRTLGLLNLYENRIDKIFGKFNSQPLDKQNGHTLGNLPDAGTHAQNLRGCGKKLRFGHDCGWCSICEEYYLCPDCQKKNPKEQR